MRITFLIITILTYFQSHAQVMHLAPQIQKEIVIDGVINEVDWQKAIWYPMNEVWLFSPPTPKDFSGRFKVLWSKTHIFLVVEIIDDTLVDSHVDGLDKYWEDDCVEVFIDEDQSGGNHLDNYNAFAYHIGLDYNVVDFDDQGKPSYFNDHVKTKRTAFGNSYTWEMAIAIYNDRYQSNIQNTPIILHSGKIMGFGVAYCDSDGSKGRELFIGSMPIGGEDKNKGYIDASVFGKLKLEN